ncbi:hypothetical protein HYFRA_00012597 [Hymenoscyphus fraxineus]|uniref:Rhodopsin domain-containing protein n=1 Tax=Hymenoscyphus fraxineus TaxID=746836 RepID=A0A9N9PM60_9HELO|nr:hypothetical protein HYFRA_00012597 [Hymenoscyphus fraxineus]
MAGYLDSTPVRPPPPGQTSNFIDPESRSYQLVILIGFLTAFVATFLLLRLYIRLGVTKSHGIDDWLCTIATILTLSYSGLILKLLWKPGGGILGIHLWDVPISRFIEYQKGSLADSILVRICSTMIRVAFFSFYLRLFAVVRQVRIMAWAGMVAVITFGVAFVIADAILCSPWPGEHGWVDPTMVHRCGVKATKLITGAAYFGVIMDFYILFIPLQQVFKLKVSRAKKIGICLVFLTGLLACGAGLTNLIIRQDKRIFKGSDFSWTLVPVYATTLVEINVGLMCHSMPVVFVPLFSRFKEMGNSLSSWIREIRKRRPSSAESYSNLASPENHTPPLIPEIPSNNNLSGIRTFVRNIYRSGVQTSTREEATLSTFNELTRADISYHTELKAMQPSQSKISHSTHLLHLRTHGTDHEDFLHHVTRVLNELDASRSDYTRHRRSVVRLHYRQAEGANNGARGGKGPMLETIDEAAERKH